jgi:hypothetical protein
MAANRGTYRRRKRCEWLGRAAAVIPPAPTRLPYHCASVVRCSRGVLLSGYVVLSCAMLCCAAQCSAGAVAVLAARASPSQSGDARVRPGLWLATGPRWAGKLGWAGLLLLWSLAPLGAAARPPSQAAQLGLIPSKLPGPCNPSVPALSRSASFLPSIEHRRHEVRYRPPVNGQQRFISLLSGLDILSTPVVCYLDCSFFFLVPFPGLLPYYSLLYYSHLVLSFPG